MLRNFFAADKIGQNWTVFYIGFRLGTRYTPCPSGREKFNIFARQGQIFGRRHKSPAGKIIVFSRQPLSSEAAGERS